MLHIAARMGAGKANCFMMRACITPKVKMLLFLNAMEKDLHHFRLRMRHAIQYSISSAQRSLNFKPAISRNHFLQNHAGNGPGSFSMLDLSPDSGQGPAGWRHVSRETVLLKVESYIEDRDADFVL